MLQSYQVLIEHSQLKWSDTPPQLQNARLIVTVLPDDIHLGDDEHWEDDEVAKLFGGD